jgi:lysozyme
MTKNGLSLIKEFEGFSLVAYKCVAGYYTIGYGNRFYLDGTEVRENDKIDFALAEQLLLHTVEDFEKQVRLLLDGLVLPEICIDALVCLAYNIGCNAFAKSTLLKKIKADKNNLDEIEKEWLRWDKANGKVIKGLTNRRKREFELYKKGILNQYTKSEIYDIYHKCNLK